MGELFTAPQDRWAREATRQQSRRRLAQPPPREEAVELRDTMRDLLLNPRQRSHQESLAIDWNPDA